MTSASPHPPDPRSTRVLLMHALAAVVASGGYEAATVAAVCEYAALPRDEFGHHFKSVDACLLELYDDMTEALTAAVEAAVDPCSGAAGADHWRIQLEAGFGAVLRYLAAVPDIACTCIVESLALGRRALGRRDAALDRFVGFVDVLRRVQGAPVPQLAAEMLVRGTYELIYARVARGDAEDLPELLDDLRTLWDGPYAPSRR